MLDIPANWKPTLGNLPRNFVGVIYGASGNGKTEFVMQVAKMLSEMEEVSWLSYEQQHDYDLKVAVDRNKMNESKFPVRWMNPLAGRNLKKSLFEELVEYIRKTRTRVIIIDSVDYVQLTVNQYYDLKAMFGHRKIIIFISHAKGRQPATLTAEKMQYDGQFGILVKGYIAWPVKSRVGGFEPHIIWEEKAREKNELYFSKLEGATEQPAKRGRKPKIKK